MNRIRELTGPDAQLSPAVRRQAEREVRKAVVAFSRSRPTATYVARGIAPDSVPLPVARKRLSPLTRPREVVHSVRLGAEGAPQEKPLMGTIVLLKDFTFAGASGQSFATDWVSFPEEHKNAELVLVVKSLLTSSSLGVQLQGTYDTDSVSSIGGGQSLTAQGTTLVQLSSGLTPMVRLLLTAAANSTITFSVYLTPKIS